jgi:calcineurin-like phosphoesterase
MTGPYESILGRRIDRVLETTLTGRPTEFEVATGDVRLCGSMIDVDPATGRATAIRRLVVTEADLPRLRLIAATEESPEPLSQ